MSIANVSEQIDYPESDGKPMGETDLHRDWMFRILEIIRYRYRGKSVYTASDLLVYYKEGEPTKFIVPDNFVVLDCEPGRRRIFKTWEEQRVPDVVFEVTSRGTSSTDIVDKPVIYEQMGVKEYFLYDPTGSYLETPLIGFRLFNKSYHEINRLHGRLTCETLGIDLRLNDGDLEMRDSETGAMLLTEAEAEHRAKEAERASKEIEQKARLSAEAQVRELQAEIERLKRGER